MVTLRRRARRQRRDSELGSILVVACFALVALLGCAALAVDGGRVMLAGSYCQNTADAAALAGAPLLQTPDAAIAAARAIIVPNNEKAGAFAVTCNYSATGTSDIVYYPPGSTVPDMGTLGVATRALRVTCHTNLDGTFCRTAGLNSIQVQRSATVMLGPVGGAPILPMWVDAVTPYNYGFSYNLLMANGPCYPGIPGNFGFLQPHAGVTCSWDDLMSGANYTLADMEAQYAEVGGYENGLTGLKVGHWVKALQDRIDRANAYYPGETFTSFSHTNPRILVIPLVTYIAGTGAGADFRIERFGAYWLDRLAGGGANKYIQGRFIQYTAPGLTLDALAPDTGLYVAKLVQ